MLGGRPISGRADWPGSSAEHARRSGRCSADTASPAGPRAAAELRRYEWSRPGALLHMDVKKLARFSVPGHRVTGDRSTNDLHRGIGYDHLHCVVDDHTPARLRRAAPARGRRHQRPHARARTRLLRRARPRPARGGDDRQRPRLPPQPPLHRRSSDNGIRHIRTPAYTPRWNGKVERFIQTLQNEWAYSRTWPDSSAAPAARKASSATTTAAPAQLTRRPATNQPRSQRLWAGQLAELERATVPSSAATQPRRPGGPYPSTVSGRRGAICRYERSTPPRDDQVALDRSHV